MPDLILMDIIFKGEIDGIDTEVHWTPKGHIDIETFLGVPAIVIRN